ncbi:hypothetical protein J5N97_013596 [Dioscorea zingiberensis]|uniref:Uncharacterized protein n=1 Tax=Dioscorea zingiberensis TaxID=325984 RepID=A0A9D5HJ87_9LILI|nr:hypothetical protein J5N97_013596 [Dioscorea zingiberensis]
MDLSIGLWLCSLEFIHQSIELYLNIKPETILRGSWSQGDGSSVHVYTGASETSGGLSLNFRRWATKKTAGSTKNGRDSNPKYLGMKKFGGERVRYLGTLLFVSEVPGSIQETMLEWGKIIPSMP